MKIVIYLFQLHAAISNQVDPEELGLGLGSGLLNNLKQTVVTLASNAGVLNTVQTAAQAVLQSGWSVLLPTAEERARALSSLLPNAGQCIHSVLGKLLDISLSVVSVFFNDSALSHFIYMQLAGLNLATSVDKSS